MYILGVYNFGKGIDFMNKMNGVIEFIKKNRYLNIWVLEILFIVKIRRDVKINCTGMFNGMWNKYINICINNNYYRYI